MKKILIYVLTIMGFVILSTVIEMTSYTLLRVPTPPGFSTKDLALIFPTKILFAFVFVIVFRLSYGSKLSENGIFYGILWFLGFSIPQEVGFWAVYKYEIVSAYAGLLSGFVTFPIWGWLVKKIKLP